MITNKNDAKEVINLMVFEKLKNNVHMNFKIGPCSRVQTSN